jgi:hypothetical protein
VGSPAEVLVAVSPYGMAPEYAHTLEDDAFYLRYLIERRSEFIFYAAEYSRKQLELLFPDHKARLRGLPRLSGNWQSAVSVARAVSVPRGARIVFFGYTEKLVMAFMAINVLAKYALILIATNNFSSRRQRRNKVQLRLFLWLARSRLAKLVVHTDYELQMVRSLSSRCASIASAKRHHLMIPVACADRPPFVNGQKPVVAFFGPVKPEKPLEPILELMREDHGSAFRYRMFGLGERDKLRIEAVCRGRLDVQIRDGHLSRDDYASAVAEADLIVLTHNRDFEGKLSGNLCDCVAKQVPFLGGSIEPHQEYVRRYGDVGYIVDLTAEGWAAGFLATFQVADLLRRKDRIRIASGSFSQDAIYSDLDKCLSV